MGSGFTVSVARTAGSGAVMSREGISYVRGFGVTVRNDLRAILLGTTAPARYQKALWVSITSWRTPGVLWRIKAFPLSGNG